MRRAFAPLIALLSLLVAACPAPRPVTSAELLSARADPTTLSMVEAAGDRAALVVIVHPGRWPAAVKTLAPLLAGIDPELDRIIEAGDLRQLIAILAGDRLDAGRELAGWDQSRPIVAGLFEPQSNETVQAARALIPSERLIRRAGVPGVRHHLLMPASDPQALAKSLAGLLGRIGLQPVDAGGPAGLKMFALQDSRGFAAIATPPPGRGAAKAAPYVRLEIMTGENVNYPDAEARLANWKRIIANPPGFHAPVTPALLAAVASPALVVVQLRPWLLSDLSAQVGTGMLVAALQYADPAMKAALLAQGLSEVANGTSLMSPQGVEFDDITLAFDLDGGLRLSWIASLTERGLAVIEAGRKGAAAPPLPAPGRRFANLWSSFDSDAAVRAAALPPGLDDVDKLDDLEMAIKECGFFCPLHFLSRAPFGLVQKIEALAPGKMTGRLPRAFALVVDRFDPAVRGLPLKLAIAAVMPPKADTRALRDLLAEAVPSAKLFVEARGKDQLFNLGLGCDPRELFTSGSHKSAPEQLGGLRIEFGPLANAIAPASPRLAAVLDRIGPLRSRVDLSGRALAGEVLVDLKGEPALAYKPFDGSCPAWKSPGADAAVTPGARCMRKVTRAMIKGFGALAAADPSQRSLMLARLSEEIDPWLKCARAEDDTRKRAIATQSALAMWIADGLEREMRDEEEIALLERVCHEGNPEVCERLAEVKARPAIKLPEIESQHACPPAGRRSIVRIAAGAAVDPAAIRPAAATGAECPALAVDASVPYASLEKIAVESGRGCRDLALLVNGSDRLELIPFVPVPRQPEKAPASDKPAPTSGMPDTLVGKSSAPPIVVRQHGTKIELSRSGETTTYEAAQKCPPQTSCRNLNNLRQALKIMKSGPDGQAKIYFQTDPDTSLGQLAPTLAVAACQPGWHEFPVGRTPLVLGPIPKQALESADKGPLKIESGPANPFGKNMKDELNRAVVKMGPPLTRAEIRRVITKNRNVARYCYEKALLKNPKLAGKVVVKFVIAKDGRVQQARIDSSTLADKQVEKCLIYAVRRFKFPAPRGGGIVKVSYPFIFNSAK